MRLGYRIRLVLNAVNGSTLLGLLVATIGRAQLSVETTGFSWPNGTACRSRQPRRSRSAT